MSLTYERPSAAALNGRSIAAATSGFTTSADTRRDYSTDEISARTGIPRTALAALAASGSGRGRCDYYTAIDVVRLAVVDRLMRSGVPVARAAALVQAAESLASTGL